MQYSIEDLVRLAKRDNNSIRPYLYVNPLQGKHIPVEPTKTIEMCKTLARKVNSAYPNDALFVIGFAETATGIASVISRYLNNIKIYQNTTREYTEGERYLYFTESHSHARDQMLRASNLGSCLNEIKRILFIDDEVTTGSTICKLIDVIKEEYDVPDLRYSIVSILNSMTSERLQELNSKGIDCLFLKSIPYEYKKDRILDIPMKNELHQVVMGEALPDVEEICFRSIANPRTAIRYSDYQEANLRFADMIKSRLHDGHYNSILIMGTEEFMYPTICVGELIQESGIANNVKVHSTTRSPIIASDQYDYPLKKRYQLRSFYDKDRITYIYNLDAYDMVLILTDALEFASGLSDLHAALKGLGNENILLGRFVYEEV